MIKTGWQLLSGRILLCAVVLIFVVTMTGCAAAFITFPSSIPAPLDPPNYLPDVKISYVPFDGTYFRKEHSMSLERTFRTRFRILDIRQISKADTSISSDRFVIRPELKYDTSLFGGIWTGISVFSLGTIPAFANQRDHVILTITAPDGDKKTFNYSYKERQYFWLPFILFNPDFFFIIMNGGEFYEEDRGRIVDAIMTQFMTEATPFILAHSVRHVQEDHQ